MTRDEASRLLSKRAEVATAFHLADDGTMQPLPGTRWRTVWVIGLTLRPDGVELSLDSGQPLLVREGDHHVRKV
jgi:hypothetical protein